jgi:phenylpyruvate tautomerase PptA (4-oxalocrotonate tautomerase family)
MTEEQQKLLESITKTIAEEFGAKFSLTVVVSKHKERKKIVIEYAEQKR